MRQTLDAGQANQLAEQIRSWAHALGFQQVGIADTLLDAHERDLLDWLARGFAGEMHYMHRHGTLRARPAELLPGTLRVISARMDYWPTDGAGADRQLQRPDAAYIARYALGRDYHKVVRARLRRLATLIDTVAGPGGWRVFTDSAPVMEKPLAAKAGLGWIGKHTNLISEKAGSWFFLGEIYTDLPLPVDTPAQAHCGTCRTCIDCCPTGAIVAPFQLDARRCISYLTIELRGPIPVEFRRAIGNRIYGCDDCQLVCPWNRFARPTPETDFLPRPGLADATLVDLFSWNEAVFLRRTEGSAIRRIGWLGWLRNIAVALGNAGRDSRNRDALRTHLAHPSELVREHVRWALDEQTAARD